MAKMVEEMEDNEEDIFFATELGDTKSNGPRAVLAFLQWLTSSASPMSNYDFVLITDDSAFVAIDKLLPKLHNTLSAASSGKTFSFTDFSTLIVLILNRVAQDLEEQL